MDKQDERRIALEIMKKVRKLNLPLKLDEITEGRGNCFPLSVLAQCRRLEIFRQLDVQTQNIVNTGDPTLLRKAVYNFILNSKNQKIINYKMEYEEIVGPLDNKNWKQYWQVMIKNYEWVDAIFIQSTAWFLGHDIIIVTTTSTEKHPFLTISGNLVDENTPCPGIELTIGSMSQVHYQSLLPITIQVQKNQIKAGFPEDTIKLKASSCNPNHSRHKIESRKHPTKLDRQGSNGKLPIIKNQNMPDLDSMTEFPDLNPTKRKHQCQTTPLTSSQKKQRGGNRSKGRTNIDETSTSTEAIISQHIQSQEIHSKLLRSVGEKQTKCEDGPKKDENLHFKYEQDGDVLSFKFISDKRVSCPKCGGGFKNILNHMKQGKCRISNFENLSQKFNQFKKKQHG